MPSLSEEIRENVEALERAREALATYLEMAEKAKEEVERLEAILHKRPNTASENLWAYVNGLGQ